MKLISAVQDYTLVAFGLGTILFAAFLRSLFRLYHARSKVLQLRALGLPMPPYNPVLGHLLFCYRMSSKLPKDAHPGYLPDIIRRELPDLGPVYYLDTWPFGPQILVVASPNSLYQITQEHSLPKYHALKGFLRPITGGPDIVTMEGQTWKTWRGIFNPGFSTGHLMTLTSGIVKETETFCDILQSHLQNQTRFTMKDLTDNLAMDVIGRVVLDTQLNSQRQRNPLVDGLRMQIKWLTFGNDINPIERYNPFRPFVHWYNARRMNRFLSPELNRRMASYQEKGGTQTAKQTKSVIDLALAAYSSEKSGKKTIQGMDSTFEAFAMSQIKLFLFSGHDTTSSTLCCLFYILSVNLLALSRIRAEHEALFGLESDKTPSLVIANPFLLNQLPYTLAVIKETLRMYPTVSSTRAGEPGFNVTDDQGRRFPTDGFLVWANPQPIHRDPTYWPEPDKFIPERWLVPPGDPLYPVKGAWRPFEFGPRNCIGQELALLELKVVMIMTLRRFYIKPVYEELDRQTPSGRINTVHGERGYQILRAQPSGDLPCRVATVIR